MINLIFTQIAILIAMSALLGIIASRFKQPPLLGYIVAGIIVNQFNILGIERLETVELFSHIGIAFLLFILGLELDLRDLKKLGTPVLLLGLGQILITFLLGFGLALILKFEFYAALITGIALTFSSTIIIVKLFSKSGELSTLHGKLAIGLLIIQDFAAIFTMVILIALTGDSGDTPIYSQIAAVLGKLAGLILVLLISTKVIHGIIDKVNDDSESLFILVIAWALLFSAIAASPIFDFSVEIGALLAGIALSTRKEHLQIEAWTRPLRDFFLTLFFVELGLNINITSFEGILIPSLVLGFFVLAIKPIISLFVIGGVGYNKRSNFLTSISIGQVSEFSLLIAALGLASGHLDSKVVSIITIVTASTMAISTYSINHKDSYYAKLRKKLDFLEFRDIAKRGSRKKKLENHVVIFGFHRLGADLHEMIKDDPNRYLIVDFDPFKVEELEDLEFNVIYGDMNDTDLYSNLSLKTADIIISTVPDFKANQTLLTYLERKKLTTPTILSAKSDLEATQLYKGGGDYVIYPHMIAGQRLKSILKLDPEARETRIVNLTKKQISTLEKRLDLSITQRI